MYVDLISVLQNADDDLCVRVSNILGQIGEDAKDAVPTLISFLHVKEMPVKFAAERALGKIGAATVDGIPNLIQLLNSTFQSFHKMMFYEMIET